MPNHIQNRLRLVGDLAEVNRVLGFIEGEYEGGHKRQIDFDKIIPMPKSLSITCDGWLSPLSNRFSANTPFKAHLDEIRRFAPDRAEDVENFIQGVRNYIQYGHATWYTWAVENWGTKWNAYDQNDKRNEPGVIYFNTAWGSANKVIKELAKQFPLVSFELTYADEDSGCNVGQMRYHKGEESNSYMPDNQSNEAYDLYFELHPDSREDFELVNGKYQYKDREDA